MTNLLAHEKSPYLRQHAENPVAWRPWTNEAFALARQEQKPIFLSIGYATCHWCHVMEGDSFSDNTIATFMNQHYIPIKVDREERPDIDQIYMRAVQALTGRGGWPLSLILSPDGKPFWGGTFLTKEQLLNLLEQVSRLWDSPEREKIMATADQIHNALAEPPRGDSVDISAYAELFLAACRNRFDSAYGGFANAPKFPPAMTLFTLMRLKVPSSDQADVKNMVVKTLEEMAQSGLCDHVSGGFHRYATDRAWKVPHFEKMLYDNALLSIAYLEAGTKYQRADFHAIAYKTLDYMLRYLKDPLGGFYSGEDADSEHSEGKFYLWTKGELKKLLSAQDFAWIEKHFDLTDDGNFKIDSHVEKLEEAAGYKPLPKEVNILHPNRSRNLAELVNGHASAILHKLEEIRNARVRPFRDEKVLAGWNGLAIAALSRGYIASRNAKYLDAAKQCASFILENFRSDRHIYRRWFEGEAKHRGVLEDYSFLGYGLFELYEADFDERWLKSALDLQHAQDMLFWSEKEGLYFDHDGSDATLIHRPNDFFDNAIPSGNSVSLLNLKRFYLLTGDESLQSKAELLAKNGSQALLSYPHGLPFFCMAVDYYKNESFLLAVNEPEALQAAQEAAQRQAFYPSLTLGKTRADSHFSALKKEPPAMARGDVFQLCSEKGCLLPTKTIEEALKPLQV